MPIPWLKLVEFAPAILNFVADRKNTRDVKDDKSQEIFNDLYKRLDAAQANDESLKNALAQLELRLHRLQKMFMFSSFITLAAILALLIKVF